MKLLPLEKLPSRHNIGVNDDGSKKTITAVAAALALMAFQAQAVNVTVAYQTSAEPAKVAQADNTFAKESGATVDWRKFDSGASVLRALASGDVQIGNIGSSPLAVAAIISSCPSKLSYWHHSLAIPKRWWSKNPSPVPGI